VNIVDALVVTFGIDATEYQKKQKEIATSLTKMGEVSGKQTKLIAEQGKKAAGAFSALKIEILGALAAFGMGAGFKAFIESSINGQAQLGRLSDALGVSTHHLQAFKLMAREVGASGDDAVNAMQTVMGGLANAKTNGPNALTEASLKYGVNLSYNDNAEQAMLKINRAVFALKQKFGAQVAMQGASALGISGLNMQMMMMESPTEFATHFAHALSLTGAATKASTEQAARLQAQWADLQERFRQVGERVFNKLEPVLARLGEQFANWLDRVDWNKVISAIGRFIDKIQQIVKEMGGWKTIAEILGGVLALKVLMPILSLTTAFARLLPMFTGAITGATGLTAAFGALGVAVAGAGGAWVGSEIWKHLLEGTKAGDKIGEVITKTLAQLGDKNAQEAVKRMEDAKRKMAASANAGPGLHATGNYHPERTDWFKAKEAQAVQYFQSQGFSRNAAIGMAANIARESTFKQNAIGDNGKAYGIGQWHPDRQANFAKVMGLPIQGSYYQQQLAFYAYEVKRNKRLMDMLSQNPNAGAAAMAVSMLNERPADKQGEMIARAKIAQGMVNAHIGAPPASQLAGTKSSTNTNTVTINGPINVNTKATDANGIAKDMGKSLRNNPLIAGSVTALN